MEFWNAGFRLSLIPFGTTGANVLHDVLCGALEVGLEPLLQQYTRPSDAQWAGMALVGRYHFLALGRSSFAFLLDGGVGASYFVTDWMSLDVAYRLQHISNGNTSQPKFRVRVAHRRRGRYLLSEVGLFPIR